MVDIVDAPAAVDVYAVTIHVEGDGPVETADWLGTIRTPGLAEIFKKAVEESLFSVPAGYTVTLELREP